MSDIRRRLPVGAEAQPDGSTHFRVWAPDPRTISLKLERGAQSLTVALEREEHGYYSALVEEAVAGTRYRYLLDDELLVASVRVCSPAFASADERMSHEMSRAAMSAKELPLHLLRRQLLEVARVKARSIVDQHIDAAEPVGSCPHRCLGIGAASDVKLDGSRSFDDPKVLLTRSVSRAEATTA